MFKKVKVKKRLRGCSIPEKVARNRNVIAQIPLHTQITGWPHSAVDYTDICDDVRDDYQLHLSKTPGAYTRLLEEVETMDLFYYDTASHVEVFANKLKDASLPQEMTFELYADPKPRTPKSLKAKDGHNDGEIILTYAKIADADSYVALIAEVIANHEAVWAFGGANSTTELVIPNQKKDTDYIIKLAYVNSEGVSEFSNPIPFRTRK